MKKINLRLLAILFAALSIVVSSCNDDDPVEPAPEPSDYESLSGSITSDMTLDNTKKYLLEGFVIIEDGVTMTIPEGTLIEANPGQGENASALIVKMGGKIVANGTASDPIIMTGKGDGKDGSFSKSVQGLWGGLIILGKATTNNTIAKRVEGVPESYAAFYGYDNNAGADDADNSGTLKYVSIRHGGSDIGAGNEINGLTLGAVGSGTIFDYVEVISNVDDGVEFFGGAPNLSHVIVSLCGDDSYDYDEGFHGKGQFWVAIQGDNTGDRLAEQDGGTGDDETNDPFAEPVIFNATYIGNGLDAYMIFRDNAAGTYANTIFHNGGNGIDVEYRDDKHSSYEWLTDASPGATLLIKNNIFSHIADGEVATQIKGKAESGDLPEDHETVMAAFFNTNANAVENLELDGDNPIPAEGSQQPTTDNPGGFFQAADYHGAFQPGGANWADGWTLMYKSK